jgi:hypothetical protein
MARETSQKATKVAARKKSAAAPESSAAAERVFLNVAVSAKTRRGLVVLREVLEFDNQGQVLERLIAEELKRHGRRVR